MERPEIAKGQAKGIVHGRIQQCPEESKLFCETGAEGRFLRQGSCQVQGIGRDL
jgi:hypothetical protein